MFNDLPLRRQVVCLSVKEGGKAMKATMRLACVLVMVVLIPVHALGEDEIFQLKEKIIDIQNKGKLGFRSFTLCSNIIGYGQYVPIPDNKVKAGSKFYFYYEPINLFTNRRDGTYQMWFTQDVLLKKEDGEVIYEAENALNFNRQTSSPLMDIFASNSLNLGMLHPGKYQFRAIIHDKLKKEDATFTYKFEVIP